VVSHGSADHRPGDWAAMNELRHGLDVMKHAGDDLLETGEVVGMNITAQKGLGGSHEYTTERVFKIRAQCRIAENDGIAVSHHREEREITVALC